MPQSRIAICSLERSVNKCFRSASFMPAGITISQFIAISFKLGGKPIGCRDIRFVENRENVVPLLAVQYVKMRFDHPRMFHCSQLDLDAEGTLIFCKRMARVALVLRFNHIFSLQL